MKLFIIGSIFLTILFCVFLFLLFRTPQSSIIPSTQLPIPTSVLLQKITPQDKRFSPFGKTTIGKSTKNEIEKLPTVLNQTSTEDGVTHYSLKSSSVFHPDEVEVKENKVVFERNTTFTNNSGGLPHISDYKSILGEPEEIIHGSKSYGTFTTTYLYPQKGVVFTGNETTNNIYEILRFLPMSLTEFKTTYGTYIEANPPITE